MDIKLYDFDDCKINERNGRYGGMAGSKEGITYNNGYWIVKYPKSTKDMRVDDIAYTTSPLSEYIGSHIYEILGYNVHKTLLGIRNNKIVVACKDFCNEPSSLIEIRTLKNIYNEELENTLETELNSTTSSHNINLKEILIHLEKNPILSNVSHINDRFWDCVIIDGFINNNDRNNGNWGLLYDDGEYTLAPIFDNGAAFSNKLSNMQIRKKLEDPKRMEASSLEIQTIYAINDKKIKFKDILNITNNDLEESKKRTIPNIINHFDKIKEFINSIPETYKELEVISPERKEFYIKGMELRLEKLLIPALNKDMEKKSLLEKAPTTSKSKEYER